MAPKKVVHVVVPADVEIVPDDGEMLTEDATGASGPMSDEESEGDLLELKGMLQWLMRDQQERDARQVIPALMDLLPPQDTCNVVLTRSQSKQNECEEEENPLLSLPFFDSELSVNQGKMKKSRRERKQEKFKETIVQVRELTVPEKLLNADQVPIPENLR
ncbi:hypothetical protein G5714_014851 [Onychostoma macrolepis]|uniref:Uncharacterized protein n=1 Tax=Onychostoma macrolepis TaxID=369639 RepID=A0A7J6C9Y7_9TELE|nr:hypothetical protein G5714_014851 [Onychostoma macrolepis]